MRRNRVTATRQAIGVYARSIIFAGNVAAGAVPCVVQRVLGIEIAARLEQARLCGRKFLRLLVSKTTVETTLTGNMPRTENAISISSGMAIFQQAGLANYKL
jgi:hypothetical protein